MKQQSRAGRKSGRKQVTWTQCAAAAETATAVAAIEPAVAAIEAGYHSGDGSSLAGSSIAGDRISSVGGDSDGDLAAAAVVRQQRFAPPTRVEGEPDRSRGKSSKFNDEPEVGNLGIFFGNWGERASLTDNVRMRRREAHDRQIMKCPGQVLVLCEATDSVARLLQEPAVAGNSDGVGLDKRSTFEWWVQRSQEDKGVLIAGRKDNTTSVELLDFLLHDDHQYKQRRTTRMARSRLLTCKVCFKQNVGHLGKEIVVSAAHGHYLTMKSEWPQVWEKWWNEVARRMLEHGTQILAGDFNVSLTRVVEALRSRGIVADCIAWYPWRHVTRSLHDQPLGFDSCGIFYIGGRVKVTLDWGFDRISQLSAVAADLEKISPDDLDVYEGPNCPGQPWHCYRIGRVTKEKEDDKVLNERLVALLTPSTTTPELNEMPWSHRHGKRFCPYLRWKQKKMHKHEWLVMDEVHPGAHFPLCAFTQNESARSEAGEKQRQDRKQMWRRSQRNTAVAGFGEGRPPVWQPHDPTEEAYPLHHGGGTTPYYQTPDTNIYDYYRQVERYRNNTRGSNSSTNWTNWDEAPMWFSTNK